MLMIMMMNMMMNMMMMIMVHDDLIHTTRFKSACVRTVCVLVYEGNKK